MKLKNYNFHYIPQPAVPNPGVHIVVNPRVKLLANINPNPNPSLNRKHTDDDARIIHVSASIKNIHLAEGDNLLHATYDTLHVTPTRHNIAIIIIIILCLYTYIYKLHIISNECKTEI